MDSQLVLNRSTRLQMKFFAGDSNVPVIHIIHDVEAKCYTIIQSTNPVEDLEVYTKVFWPIR